MLQGHLQQTNLILFTENHQHQVIFNSFTVYFFHQPLLYHLPQDLRVFQYQKIAALIFSYEKYDKFVRHQFSSGANQKFIASFGADKFRDVISEFYEEH